jgi:hypothetical protein
MSRAWGGFTLVEMLAVSAVVIVLAAIVLPALLAVKERAKPGMRQPPPTGSEQPRLLHECLAPYIRNNDVWYCPSDRYARQKVLYLGIFHQYTSYVTYWADYDQMGKGIWWPIRMSLLSETRRDFPLLMDANGIPHASDSAAGIDSAESCRSNHSDRGINYLRTDAGVGRSPCTAIYPDRGPHGH